MIALIGKIYAEADPLRNPFRSSDQIPLLRAKEAHGVRSGMNPPELYGIKLQLALQLLQAGHTEESYRQHEAVERFLAEHNQVPNARALTILGTGKALCHLRAGEKANCLLNHNADSCLFPIRDGGVHQLPEGSRAAVAELTALLTQFPGDLRARWLLNIAYMTLGEYPDKVPPRWLLDPKLFASDHDLKRFPDIAGSLGLA
ncbi:MAG TPA: hypothetical protein VHN79_09420, partial [Lacunisphaera sp.]|nr:hypothetical protein [Lacunisphaera sp.]